MGKTQEFMTKARFVVGALELEVIPSRRVSLVFLCPNSYEEFIFQSWDGSVYKANAQHNQTQLLLKNTTFATFKASQFALSPDLNYVLLGYDVQQCTVAENQKVLLSGKHQKSTAILEGLLETGEVDGPFQRGLLIADPLHIYYNNGLIFSKTLTDECTQHSMRRCAYLCSEVSGEGNDPEVDVPKRQEARVQEEGHGLLLSPRQAMISERAGEGVVKQKPVSK
ncbi:unnamed protein product [Arctogadus glacialis]